MITAQCYQVALVFWAVVEAGTNPAPISDWSYQTLSVIVNCVDSGSGVIGNVHRQLVPCYGLSKPILCQDMGMSSPFHHLTSEANHMNKIKSKTGNKTRRHPESAYIRQVHDNVMMYTSTGLHKHLPMYLRSRCVACQ